MMEVTELPKEQIKYPVARKNIKNGFIVIFFSENSGVFIDSTKIRIELGEWYFSYNSIHDRKYWEPVNITITG